MSKHNLTGSTTAENPAHERWWSVWDRVHWYMGFLPAGFSLVDFVTRILVGDEPEPEVELELDFVFSHHVDHEAWGDTYVPRYSCEVEEHVEVRMDGFRTTEEALEHLFGPEEYARLIDSMEADGMERGEEDWLRMNG